MSDLTDKLEEVLGLVENAPDGPWTYAYGNSDHRGGGCWYALVASDGSTPLNFPYGCLAEEENRAEASASGLIASLNFLSTHADTLRAMAKDAERYRWLREYYVDSYLAAGIRDVLDSSIDSAMKESAK